MSPNVKKSSSVLITIARAARLRSAARGEDGVAIMSTLLFMILLTGMSLVLLSVIISQVAPSHVAQKSTKTVYAAQAGLQSALGALRSASTTDAFGDTWGDFEKLPCAIDGRVDGAGNHVTYDVNLRYYTADPTGKNETWLEANKMLCTTGLGVAMQPGFAYVTSKGKATSNPGVADDQGNRAVAAVYQFKVSNENIPGGRIYDFDRNNCLEAVPISGTVKAGSKVRYVSASSCDSNDDRQMWIYDSAYQIKLAITTADDAPGLCITGPDTGNHTQDAVLKECRTNGSRWNQLWSWTGQHSWRGQTPSTHDTSDFCLARSDSKTGSHYYLQTRIGCSGTFSPDPAVGSGAASYGTHQIVNYKEFGRCLDVTGEVITSTYMISYPCKQDPTGTGVNLSWNHKWYYLEPLEGHVSRAGQQIYVYHNDNTSQKRCLQTPTGAAKHPTFKVCNTSAEQKWTRVYDTGVYAGSYLFIDNQGRCITADASDKLDGNWSKITVVTCGSDEAQKWNAPASYNASTFGGFKELGE